MDGRNGGADRTVWEMLLEMERKNSRQEKSSRSDRFGLGSGDSFRVGKSSSGVGLGDAFHFPRKILRVLWGVLRAGVFSLNELLAITYCIAGRNE